MMNEERYKELMAQTGMPDSRSLLQVLKQAVMEATLEERFRMESECKWCGHANHHDVQYGCTEDGCECLGSPAEKTGELGMDGIGTKATEILRAIAALVDRGERIGFEQDWGYGTATVLIGGGHTHVGRDDAETKEEDFQSFVDGLHDLLVLGRGLSIATMEEED